VRFPNTALDPLPDDSSLCIHKDLNKCILCGDCVRMCNEVQSVGAIDFAYRGSKMRVSTAFGIPIAESNCVGCGQCAAVCPTGAITVHYNIEDVWRELDNKDAEVSVQIAPSVRVALGKALSIKEGENSIGKIVAALRRIGFDKIYDTSTGADLTVLEESRELVARLSTNQQMPMFTSCCPAWVNYCEKHHPELMPHVSTCRSPMQMFAAVIKEQTRNAPKRHVHIAVMPCTAKKFEAARKEFTREGIPNVDYVLTTKELIRMIKESGLIFDTLEPEAVDIPFGLMSGAGMIFGVTGGVTEAVLRSVSTDKSTNALQSISLTGIRGMDGVKEASITVGDREVKIAVLSGLGNAEKLIQELVKGTKHYDFVEVMACPGGCVNGAGQPYARVEQKAVRGAGLYSADKMCSIKRSEENPVMTELYKGLLKDKAHELLHVHYTGAEHAAH
jgi:NADH-quinone oxidoreductase subunit G